jgi:hypothetical protein
MPIVMAHLEINGKWFKSTMIYIKILSVMVDVLSKVRTYCLSKNKVANKVAITQMSSQQVVSKRPLHLV